METNLTLNEPVSLLLQGGLIATKAQVWKKIAGNFVTGKFDRQVFGTV